MTDDEDSHSANAHPRPMLSVLWETVFREMSADEARRPTDREMTSWMLDQFKSNPTVSDMFWALLAQKEELVARESELPGIESLGPSLKRLERIPLPRSFFISVTRADEDQSGILYQRDSLVGGGYVYSATVFRPESGINLVSRLEVRVCEASPEPFVSALLSSGWVTLSLMDFHTEDVARLVVQGLLMWQQYKHPSLAPSEIALSEDAPEPPPNPELVSLLADAYRDRVPCTKAMVPMSLIEPRTESYALNISEDLIRSMMRSARAGDVDLLLYEDSGQLIMDDDYPVYLAYLALETNSVPAVIVGQFDESGVQVLKRGWSELIPPIGVTRKSRGAPKLTGAQRLKQKVASLRPTVSASDAMVNTFIQFCRLMAQEKTHERQLHDFLKNHPVLLDCHSALILSEVKIGRYRADLALRYDLPHKSVLLVELERHDGSLFKSNNRFTHKVNHAYQQVEDWIREIRRDAKGVPDWLRGLHSIEGAVVMGRPEELTPEQRDTIASNNAGRLVKILTYDDLLERFKRLILAMSDIEEANRPN